MAKCGFLVPLFYQTSRVNVSCKYSMQLNKYFGGPYRYQSCAQYQNYSCVEDAVLFSRSFHLVNNWCWKDPSPESQCELYHVPSAGWTDVLTNDCWGGERVRVGELATFTHWECSFLPKVSQQPRKKKNSNLKGRSSCARLLIGERAERSRWHKMPSFGLGRIHQGSSTPRPVNSDAQMGAMLANK